MGVMLAIMLIAAVVLLFLIGFVFLMITIIEYDGKVFLFYEDMIEEFDRHKEWKENRKIRNSRK